MPEETAPEVEAKKTEEEAKEVEKKDVETKVDTTKKETSEEKTIDETLELSEKKESKTVPEATLIKYKKENKVMAKELRDLKSLIEDGGDKGEVSRSLDAIADEHNIDKKFLRDFAKQVREETESDIDEKINSQLKPLTDKAKADKINSLFEKEYKRTLEAMPEFKDIASKEVIKSLTLDPANRKKTFSKIIEDAYGHLITGKRTLEKTTPRGGNEVAGIDYKKAKTDTAYFKEIMDNPTLKKKYNEGLAKRIDL